MASLVVIARDISDAHTINPRHHYQFGYEVLDNPVQYIATLASDHWESGKQSRQPTEQNLRGSYVDIDFEWILAFLQGNC